MSTYPRAVHPRTVSDLTLPRGSVTVAQSGVVQRRGLANKGVTWRESYQPIKSGDTNVEALRAFVRDAAHNAASFTVKHLRAPGSGLAPNGTGTTGVTISGSSQTGNTLVTTGWPASTTGVVRAGDVIKPSTFNHVLIATEDANSGSSGNATITFSPTIFAGGSPSTGTQLETKDIAITAMVEDYQMPDTPPDMYMRGFTVSFRELP